MNNKQKTIVGGTAATTVSAFLAVISGVVFSVCNKEDVCRDIGATGLATTAPLAIVLAALTLGYAVKDTAVVRRITGFFMQGNNGAKQPLLGEERQEPAPSIPAAAVV